MIDWSKVSTEDHDTIVHIANRVRREALMPIDKMSLIMDLTAAHIQCPIDLRALLEADATTFNHDVGGIVRHMDRETGELGGCFVPRTARRAALSA